jgi:hypothetical protein
MKTVAKLYRMPEPLAKALPIAAHKREQNQTKFLVNALVSALEEMDDPRISAFVKEYRDHQGELNGDSIEDEIPEHLR